MATEQDRVVGDLGDARWILAHAEDEPAEKSVDVGGLMKEAGADREVAVDPDREEVDVARGRLRRSVAATLRSVGEDVCRQVAEALTRMGKSDPPPDDGGAADSLDLSGLRALVDPTYEQLAYVARDSAAKVLAGVGLERDAQDAFERADEAAAAWAQERAAEMVGMRRNPLTGDLTPSPDAQMAITDSTRDMLRGIIGRGLRDATGNREIVEQVRQQGFGAERAELIAFTEVSHAHSQGALAGLTAAKSVGVRVKKKWLTARDDLVDHNVCLLNEAAGAIDLERAFPSGAATPPGHPRCRCALGGVVTR